jgi:cytochrome c
MYMRKFALLFFIVINASLAETIQGPNLGNSVNSVVVDKWNRDVFPDGEGLPDGAGTAKKGKEIYEQQCLACHGVEGTGGSADELAGAQHSLTDDPPDKIIGNYWPFATTIFDFIRRSMPLQAPGSLSNDEVYAVTAYLLVLNGIIGKDQVINKITLPLIKMPNRTGFINSFKN